MTEQTNKLSDDLWAPEVAKVGNQYIMYYTVSTFGSQNSAIGYATSFNMEFNSWTDHGATGLQSRSGDNYNAIDANYIQVPSTGERFLNFGSFWGGIHQVILNSAGTQVAGGALGLQFQPAGTHASEGPFMFERQGWYYLFWSEGTCCGFDKNLPAPGAEYKIRVCRSQNFRGTFVDRNGVDCRNGGGTTVLESHGFVYGPGGQGIMTDPRKGTILYYREYFLSSLACVSRRAKEAFVLSRDEVTDVLSAAFLQTTLIVEVPSVMVIRSLAGTSSTGAEGGRLFEGMSGARLENSPIFMLVALPTSSSSMSPKPSCSQRKFRRSFDRNLISAFIVMTLYEGSETPTPYTPSMKRVPCTCRPSTSAGTASRSPATAVDALALLHDGVQWARG